MAASTSTGALVIIAEFEVKPGNLDRFLEVAEAAQAVVRRVRAALVFLHDGDAVTVVAIGAQAAGR